MVATIQKEFLGQTFSYRAEVGENGKALWTHDIDKNFSKWIYRLKEDNRELFKVQYSLSSNAYDVFNKLKEHIGVYDESLLARAITIIFINFIDTRKGKSVLKKLSIYKDSGAFEVLQDGERVKRSLYFSPVGMRDVVAYSKLTGLKKCQVIKNALYSVLLISINEDEKIKRFWEQEILSKITDIVKAA